MHTETKEEVQEAKGEKEITLEDVMVEIKVLTTVIITLTEAFADVINSNNILALAIEKRNNETNNEHSDGT